MKSVGTGGYRTMCYPLLVILVLAITCDAGIVPRTILFLQSDSGSNFDTMWNTPAAINDPSGDQSTVTDFLDILGGTDFKVFVDPAWGDIIFLQLYGINGLGDELCFVLFDVMDINISRVDNWFIPGQLRTIRPVHLPGVATVVRQGQKEMMILTGSNEAWFSIVHSTGGSDPTIVLAVNSSSPLTVNGDLEALSTSIPSGLLLSESHVGGHTFTINVTSQLQQLGWDDTRMFVDQIAINATNSSGEHVLFSIDYSDSMGLFYKEYRYAGKAYFDTDGAPVLLQVLPVECIRINYEWDVMQSTIELYGPMHNSYVNVPYIVVTATIGTASTATGAVSTTTDALTTAGAVSTTTDTLYAVFANMSVLVNGTLYCPCNITSNTTTTTLNITSIYDNSNKTFEELIADLTLDSDTLSKNKRKYSSAKDNRPSAVTLGAVAIVVMVTVVSFVVFLDSATLVMEVVKIKKAYKILKKRMSKRSLKVEAIDVQCVDNPPDMVRDIPT